VKRILIAEDDAASREFLAELLMGWGYRVIEASTGMEALQQAKETNPDVILLDIQMPLLDGYAVIRRLRSDPEFSSRPVIALTAYAMREDRARISEAGFDAHIAKPVDTAALRSLLAGSAGSGELGRRISGTKKSPLSVNEEHR
jgi:CheY-like chemotaxis protein